jgi:hypothetical protein
MVSGGVIIFFDNERAGQTLRDLKATMYGGRGADDSTAKSTRGVPEAKPTSAKKGIIDRASIQLRELPRNVLGEGATHARSRTSAVKSTLTANST